MTEDWQNGGFGLYIHWPFCAAKCPYCDFNSHVTARIDHARWQAAYLAEIDRVAALTGPRVLGTVYFGGGTPSLMEPDVVAAIIERLRKHWPAANDQEITLEANPTSVEAGRFAAFADAGVNRVSLGLQALNDDDLRRLGRMHSAAEGRAAFDIARKQFDRVSFDLIYARQNQDLPAWEAELREALAMAVDHLSLYQLTIEAGTAFGDRYSRGKLRGLPDDDSAADMYLRTRELCHAAGLEGYEVSNHARPGAESRHNLVYWRYGDYAGIGPGAHARLTLEGQRRAIDTPLQPGAWLKAAEAGCGENPAQPLSGAEQAEELVMMGLRLREGIDTRRVTALAGRPLPEGAIAELQELGLVARDGPRLKATEAGLPVLNGILRQLLAG